MEARIVSGNSKETVRSGLRALLPLAIVASAMLTPAASRAQVTPSVSGQTAVTRCAGEQETCNINGWTWVYFGADNKWTAQQR